MAQKSVIHPVKLQKSQDVRIRADAVPAYRVGQSRWMNVERALRSAAFLLDWSCDSGNEDVDGPLAFAISRVLDQATTEVAEMRAFFMAECMRPAPRAAKSGRS